MLLWSLPKHASRKQRLMSKVIGKVRGLPRLRLGIESDQSTSKIDLTNTQSMIRVTASRDQFPASVANMIEGYQERPEPEFLRPAKDTLKVRMFEGNPAEHCPLSIAAGKQASHVIYLPALPAQTCGAVSQLPDSQ
jgi:hypothetical protein